MTVRGANLTLSSFLCGLAPSLGVLVIFPDLRRAVGAGIAAEARQGFTNKFPLEKRGMAFAVLRASLSLWRPTIGRG